MFVAMTVLLLFTSTVACDEAAERDGTSNGGPPASATGADGDQGTTGSEPGDDGEASAQVRDVEIVDRRSDRSTTGSAPAFVEIDGASIEGDTQTLALTMTLAGKVPELMPDEVTTMRVTFITVTRGADRYEFFAHATRNGWALFASGREDAELPFTEEVQIEGRTLTMTIDRSYLGPPAPFKWTANVAWTRRAKSGEAYAFDFVPKQGYADFP
jgi:hypothetical protein